MSKVDLLKKQMRASAASSRSNKPSASPYINEIEEMILEMVSEPVNESVNESVKEPVSEPVKEPIKEPVSAQEPVTESTKTQELPASPVPTTAAVENKETTETVENIEAAEAVENIETAENTEKIESKKVEPKTETVEPPKTIEPKTAESKKETTETPKNAEAQPANQKDNVQSEQTDASSPVNRKVQQTKADRILKIKQFKSTELISWGALLSEEANDTLSYYAAVHSMNAYNVVNSIIASEIEWEKAHPEFPSKEFVMSNIKAKRNREVAKVSRSLTITEEHRSFVKAASIRCGMKMQEFMEYLIIEYLSEEE